MRLPESVEHLIVGAGPAGLRAAEVLSGSGREVLVVERHETVGPKVCAGGLTQRSVTELGGMGDANIPSLTSVTHASFRAEPPVPLLGDLATVRTVSRRDLGRWQLARARSAGAEIRTGTTVHTFDLPSRTVQANGRTIRYRHLIGADGADSGVRRALGIPSPRAIFAGEFNVPTRHAAPLSVMCDSDGLANGYWWLFPHADYTSIGAIAPKRMVPPARLRQFVSQIAQREGISTAQVPFEGATLEVHFGGVHFADHVHLIGDAAGLPSALTGEGIYAALMSGAEVARALLDPGYPCPRLVRWLRLKRFHATCLAILTRRRLRELVYRAGKRAAIGRPRSRQVLAWLLTTG